MRKTHHRHRRHGIGDEYPDNGHRGGDDGNHGRTGPLPGGYKNLVVIYEENHSFDNLLAGWGTVGRTGLARRGEPSRAGRQGIRLSIAERCQPDQPGAPRGDLHRCPRTACRRAPSPMRPSSSTASSL